jgi:hypothetical protein
LLSRGNDYTATDGTTITLIDATITGDIIEVFANATIPLTDTYSQSVANGKFINNTLTTTTGDIIYASAANTPARLGIGSTDQVLKVTGGVPAWGASPSPSFVGVSAVRSSSFTVNSATATAISLNSADEFDTDAIHDPNTNPSRFTIPSGKGGKWLCNVSFLLAGQTAVGSCRLLIYKNGGTWMRRQTLPVVANAGEMEIGLSEIVTLSAGDYIEFYIWQNTYASITCYCGTNSGGEKQGTAQLLYLGA